MPNNKPYTAPVWWIAIIILVKIAMAISFVIGVHNLEKSTYSDYYYAEEFRRIYRNQLISQGVLIIILLAEAITYWKVRTRIKRKRLVWIHIAGLLLPFAVMPIAYTSFNIWLATQVVAADYSDKIRNVGVVQSILMWTCVIVGHICFVMVLIDAFRKRKEEAPPPAPDRPDILDDYAENN